MVNRSHGLRFVPTNQQTQPSSTFPGADSVRFRQYRQNGQTHENQSTGRTEEGTYSTEYSATRQIENTLERVLTRPNVSGVEVIYDRRVPTGYNANRPIEMGDDLTDNRTIQSNTVPEGISTSNTTMGVSHQIYGTIENMNDTSRVDNQELKSANTHTLSTAPGADMLPGTDLSIINHTPAESLTSVRHSTDQQQQRGTIVASEYNGVAQQGGGLRHGTNSQESSSYISSSITDDARYSIQYPPHESQELQYPPLESQDVEEDRLSIPNKKVWSESRGGIPLSQDDKRVSNQSSMVYDSGIGEETNPKHIAESDDGTSTSRGLLHSQSVGPKRQYQEAGYRYVVKESSSPELGHYTGVITGYKSNLPDASNVHKLSTIQGTQLKLENEMYRIRKGGG